MLILTSIMNTVNESSLFYEFSPECASKAQDLCDKLKLQRDETESYNPYEWMFTSDADHYCGSDYETYLIRKTKVATERREELEEKSASAGDVIGLSVTQTREPQIPTAHDNLDHSITPDLLTRIGLIQASLHADTVESDSGADAIDLISRTPLLQIPEVCSLMRLGDLNESSLTVISQALIKHDQALSYAASCIVIQQLFKNKILTLQQSPSRVFSTTLLATAKQFPQQMVDVIMLPVVQECGLGVPQCEIICRMVKESLKLDHVNLFLRLLLDIKVSWTEIFVPLVQIIIELKVPVNPQTLTSLLKRCETESPNLKSSLKFSKLLQSTVNKYGSIFTVEDVQRMMEALKENQTFLRKSIESSLQKLQR